MLNNRLIGKIIQCHIDHSDPDTFVVGLLVFADSFWFLMQDITPAGKWNGFALYMQADIVSIRDDTEYIYRIKRLLKYRNESPPMLLKTEASPLTDLLNHAKEEKRIVCLELYASGYRDVCGYVVILQDDMLCIDQVDEFGNSDGRSLVAIDSITRCFMDDEESRCLEILAK